VKPPFNVTPCGGITEGSQQDTILVPYNDLEGFLDRVKHEELACVIIEPVMGAAGIIPAEKKFLKGLREFCNAAGALLIFDEVVTGFRLGLSGAQGYYSVTPDLTALGKIIGGGLPIGAVCGKRDVMERIDDIMHSDAEYAYSEGTAGNSLSFAAGLATIQVLQDSLVYAQIDRLGEIARESLNAIFEKNAFRAQATGLGSLFAIHMTNKKPLRDAKSYVLCDLAKSRSLFNHLLDKGILILTPEMLHGAISYAHTEEDIENLVSTVERYVSAAS
jgi:glutamate-1-semialdehyde 2,1-aminomutase